MVTGIVSKISTQRDSFGEIHLEIFLRNDGSETQYFTRSRTIALMAMAQMLRPENSQRLIHLIADSEKWITSFELV